MRTPRHSSFTTTPATDALLGLSLFAGCSPADVAGLLPDTDLARLPATTVIDREGTRALQFVGIVDGHVRGIDPLGRPYLLGPGDHIGADELVADQLHETTYTASTPVTVVAVFGPTFRSWARRIPALAGPARTPRDGRRHA